MIGSSGAVTVLFVPTNAPRLVGYDRGQGGRLGGGLHQPSCIEEIRKGGTPEPKLFTLADVGGTSLPFKGGLSRFGICAKLF